MPRVQEGHYVLQWNKQNHKNRIIIRENIDKHLEEFEKVDISSLSKVFVHDLDLAESGGIADALDAVWCPQDVLDAGDDALGVGDVPTVVHRG